MDLKGLTSKEVKEKILLGEVNKSKRVSSKSHLKIVFDSFFSFFNIILLVVALIFLLVQINFKDGISYIPLTKYGFLIVLIFNSLISIVTEEKAKRVLDKMELLKNKKVKVIRDNKEIIIDSTELVVGDIYLVSSKEEVLVDSKLISDSILVNQAIVTGESDFIKKERNEEILSGSIIESSSAYLKVIKVGDSSFIKSLENEVKKIKKEHSILKKELNKIIFIVTMFMIPAFIAVFLKTYYIGIDGNHWVFSLNIVSKTSTVVVGMISIGLVLLSSITLSQSIISLSKDKVMVKDLYSIENLARIDTICFDKTGTLTENVISINSIECLKNKDETLEELGIYLNAFDNDNMTSVAIKKYLNSDKKEEYQNILPFNSTYKYSSCSFLNNNYKLGAPDVLIKDEDLLNKINSSNSLGKRTLVFIKNEEVIAIIYLVNKLRNNIKETINYFNSINVDIKIISGDNLETVKNISYLAGISKEKKAISLEGIDDKRLKEIVHEYSLFARATPHQKELIISTLKENGHNVGYVGDGVNDLSSIKRANCSIALNSGISSLKSISDFVLLSDDFSSIPKIINEGRRTINNIKRTCLLFLSKAFFIFFYALFSLFSKEGFVIEIESLYIYEWISVALCGFLLSIEKNNFKNIETNFIKDTIYKSLFLALFLSFPALVLIIISNFLDFENLESMISILLALEGSSILFLISFPYSKYSLRVSILGLVSSILLMLVAPDVFLTSSYIKKGETIKEQFDLIFKDLFNLNLFKSYSNTEIICLLVILFSGILVFSTIYYLVFIKQKKK